MNQTGPGSDPSLADFRAPGRPLRRFPAAVSAEAQALAWANREDGPHGAAVVVTHEVAARLRRGDMWWAPAESTLACAVVVRPALSADEGDAVWLAGGLAAARAAQAIGSRPLRTWWPDLIVDADGGHPVAAVTASIQLGPGQVRSAVVTVRFDLGRLGVDPARRDDLVEALLAGLDGSGGEVPDPSTMAAAYAAQCALLGKRVKLSLRPKGETRGVVGSVDHCARLVLESPTGMVERIPVDGLGELQIVGQG